MRSATGCSYYSNFWKNVGRYCNKISKDGVNSHFEIMKSVDSLTRQRVWKGNTFKQEALICYIKDNGYY